jgi:RHS repeat-associated protein
MVLGTAAETGPPPRWRRRRLKEGERMKALKILGLVAVAAVASIALIGAGTASATALCKNNASTTSCSAAYGSGTEVKTSLVSGTKSKLVAEGLNVECGKSSMVGKSSNAGSASETVKGSIETLTFEECGNNTVTVLKNGSLEIHHTSGTDNGTVTSTGAEITILTHLPFLGTIHCIYATNSTDLGTLTGGNPAKLSVNAEVPRVTTSPFCSEKATWTAEYEVTSPKPLYVSAGFEALVSTTEKYGECNPAATYLDFCLDGDPVNSQTGNLTEAQTDLSLGGRGPALAVTRSYNSLAAVEAKEAGPWGYGWSGPYSSRLEINKESGAVTVVQGNGATAAFSLSGGKYVPGAWVQATLVKETVEGKEIYVFTLPTQEQFKFNSEGQLTEQKDRNGNAITFTYSEGKLTKAKDGAGRELVFTYTGSQVTQVEDPLGNKVKYAYESGDLTSVTLPGEESARWKFKYDASHRLTEMTDGRGGVLKNEYDEKHRVKKQTDPMERVISFEYGEAEGYETTTITEPNGSTTFEKFNEAGEPLELIRAKGTSIEQKTTNEYDAAYRLIKTTDALGHSTSYEYNAAGDRTLEKDAEGNEAKWTYTAAHDVETETTPKGEKTTYKRDAKGNVEAIERPAPGETTQKWTFKYASNGDMESKTDPLGHETKFEYDTYGNLKAEINAEGDKRTWTYDNDGRVTSEVSPRGNEEGAKAEEFETTIEPDAQGRPKAITDPLGHETTYKYDKNGNLESITDANAHTTKYTYNANDEKTKVEAANGNTTETAYDSMGKVKSKTNGNGKTTEYKRNLLSQVTEVIDPLERKTTKEYDKAGNLEKLKDPESRTTTYTYDKADRLTKVDYSSEATTDVTYEYDKNSNVTKMVDGTGTTKKTFDILGRLTEVENGNKEVVKYEYNLDNLITKITYPNGKAVTRAYDKADRLEKVTDWLSGETKFAYNRDSELKTTTFPTASTNKDEYEYNTADQLTKVTMKKGSETLASLTYARDKIGQVESETQTGLPGGEKTEFKYDEKDRLTKAASTEFKYDAADNPTTLGATTLKYDKASQLEEAGTTKYVFDKLGQRTEAKPSSGPVTKYGYDQAGNLTSVNRTAEGEVPKIEDTYTYDGNGLRASQKVSGTTKQLAWDVNAPLPLLLYDGTNYYLYGPDGLPFAQIASETPTYLHHDQLGSTRLLTNSSGEAKGTYTYSVYGAISGQTGTATTPLGWAGQLRNDSTGLIYLRARVYDPTTAQFLSVDPLAMQTGETYGYAEQNPVNAEDPTGELGWRDTFKLTGKLLSAASLVLAVVPVTTPIAVAVGVAAAAVNIGVGIYEMNQGNVSGGVGHIAAGVGSIGGLGVLASGAQQGTGYAVGASTQVMGGSLAADFTFIGFMEWLGIVPENVLACDRAR